MPLPEVSRAELGDAGEHAASGSARRRRLAGDAVELFVDQLLDRAQFFLDLPPLVEQRGDLFVDPLNGRHPPVRLLEQRDGRRHLVDVGVIRHVETPFERCGARPRGLRWFAGLRPS